MVNAKSCIKLETAQQLFETIYMCYITDIISASFLTVFLYVPTIFEFSGDKHNHR